MNYSYLSEVSVKNIDNDGNILISYIDKALLFDVKNTVQAKQWRYNCYSNSAPSETEVKRSYADFKRGRTNTNDTECSSRPNLAVVPENTKRFFKLVSADRKLKLREIADELKISEDSVLTILYEYLSMCLKWVLHLLTVD